MTVLSPEALGLTAQEVHEALMRRRRRERRELATEAFKQRRHPLSEDAHLGNSSVVITNRPPGCRPAMVRRPGAPPKETGRADWRLQEPVRKPDESDYAWKVRLRKYERLMRAVT